MEPDGHAQQVQEDLLCVLRAAGRPMRSMEILGRVQQIGGTVRPSDLSRGLTTLAARCPEVRMIGRVPGAPNSERIWAYRVPDDQCVQLDQVSAVTTSAVR